MKMLLEWPVELVELVLVNLNPLQVVRCREVCRYLLELIDASTELRLRIELAEDGHLLLMRGNEPAISLRARVLSHRRALDHINLRHVFKTGSQELVPIRYDIVDGIVFRLIEVSHPTVYHIEYYELDCHLGRDRWQHTWDSAGAKISDLSFSPGHDLQILTEDVEVGRCKRLHYRTISTNAPHPHAGAAVRDFELPEFPVWLPSFTTILGNIVFTLFKSSDLGNSGVFALNWTTDRIILPFRNAASAAFIAHDLLLLAVTLETEGQQNEVIFETISLTSGNTLYRCLLPFSSLGHDISFVNNRNFNYPPNPFLSKPKEFISDLDLNIVGVEVDFDVSSLTSVIIVVSIKKMIEACEGSAQSSPEKPVEWDDWGPKATRWLPKSWSSGGDLCVFGSRISVWDNTRGHRRRGLSILDFNPRNLRRSNLGEDDVIVVNESSDTTYELGGEQLKVTSSLPYRKVFHGPSPYYNVDIDGMTLVCREELTDLHFLSLLGEDD